MIRRLWPSALVVVILAMVYCVTPTTTPSTSAPKVKRMAGMAATTTVTVTLPLSGLTYAQPQGWPAPTLVKERAFVLVPTGAFVPTGQDKFGSPTGTLTSGCTNVNGPYCSLDSQIKYPSGSSLVAGDTFWLRGGTYTGRHESWIKGTAIAPIKIRAFPGERVTFDGGCTSAAGTNVLVIGNDYVWWWGIEAMSSCPGTRTTSDGTSYPADITYPGGFTIETSAPPHVGVKLINTIVHDTRQGVSLWETSPDVELYGSLSYYNGWKSTSNGSHGHNLYNQNSAGALSHKITDNIFFMPFDHNMQTYGSSTAVMYNSALLRNFFVRGGGLNGNDGRNLLIGGADITGTGNSATEDWYYFPRGVGPGTAVKFGYGGGTQSVTLTGEKFWCPVQLDGPMNGLSITNSTFGDAMATDHPSGTFTSSQYGTGNSFTTADPTVNDVRVLPNQYEPGRCTVEVMNWANAATQVVDISACGITGPYEIRNAFDYYGPIIQPNATPTATSTPTPSSTVTPSATPSATQTPTMTWTPLPPTATVTQTVPPTATAVNTATLTAVPPTATRTKTPTKTPVKTKTPMSVCVTVTPIPTP